MERVVLYLFFVASLCVEISCGVDNATCLGTTSRENAVVYDAFDSQEYSETTSENIAKLVMKSVVALIGRASLTQFTDGTVGYHASSAQEIFGLCGSERWAAQPSLAACSGVLVANDLVLTAGHCLPAGHASCMDIDAVFGWVISGDSPPSLFAQESVYHCRRIVAQQEFRDGDIIRDYALFQLDRSVESRYHDVVTVNMERTMMKDDAVLNIGTPLGVPMKIDAGGVVVIGGTHEEGYFVATTDSFERSSGSPVFGLDSLALVGIVVEGERDFVVDGDCRRARRCSYSSCAGETIAYVAAIISAVCDNLGHLSLCGREPVCGDRYCDSSEEASCPEDCKVVDEHRGLENEEADAVYQQSSGCASARGTKAVVFVVLVLLVGGFYIRGKKF